MNDSFKVVWHGLVDLLDYTASYPRRLLIVVLTRTPAKKPSTFEVLGDIS
jgi:hypothetical protein